MKRLVLAIAAGGFALGLVAPAFGQPLACSAPNVFDPACNHLKCYKIRGGSFATSLRLDNQFGRERVFKLIPAFLCAPTEKSCCDAAGNCSPTACQPDPAQPRAPVHHFKCYKIQTKQCADPTCARLVGKFPPAPPDIVVRLLDQFHVEDNVKVGPPKMLCVPVVKEVISPTTSTTIQTTTTTQSTTTSTTNPCRDIADPGTAPMCAGPCPAPLECVFVSGVGCTCEIGCALQGPAPGTCNNQFCPKAGQQCIPNANSPCSCCFPPGAGPCAAGSECCSGVCTGGTCQ